MLAAITARMKGERALIYIHDLKANRLLFSVGHRLDPKYIALYEEKHLAGPLLPRIMQLTAGSLLTDKNPIMTYQDMQQSAFYRDVLAPLNVYYASVTIILRQQDALGMLWVARSHDGGNLARRKAAPCCRWSRISAVPRNCTTASSPPSWSARRRRARSTGSPTRWWSVTAEGAW